ncbi:MAG TPA: CheR family methyltransferase [Terracidiphilus sp.]|nr:CheR family methyltransferase [Terracidiphilus sp.]
MANEELEEESRKNGGQTSSTAGDGAKASESKGNGDGKAGTVGAEAVASKESGAEPEDTVAAVEGTRSRAPEFGMTVESQAAEQQGPALPYPVAGFGASAGGLQAFKEILENLDPQTGMAFVLVTHLAPDQRSFLSEIVERYTQMPVVSVEDGQRPLPDHLYVVLPNQSLTLREGLFHVEHRPASDRIPRTIDKFFHSLAADQKNHAVGVVLSGADADGALGLKAIKGEGGIAIVQTPDTAVHSGMPRSSIASDHVDLVIPPAEIAMELARLARQFTRPEVRSLEIGVVPSTDEQSFQKILQQLRTVAGLDFRQYKPETLRRRIARRMILLRIDHLAEYHRFLQIRTDELRNLHEDVLINVTRFFRDPGFWESLRTSVLPVLLQDRPPEKPIRVWCAGCSTGEEAYSLAISVLEYLSQHGLDTPVQVFGTDASDQSVETARMAVYPESLITDISQERLRRYFVKVDRGYQVSKRVRDTCIFARQNLCSDPPFSHIDILSCRNVMIYFNQPLQRQIMLTFHYALEPGGYMLMGMSEGLRDYGDVFSAVDRKYKIYMKTGVSLPFSYEPPRGYLLRHGGGIGQAASGDVESTVWPELELQRAADRIVLARFGPPGLVIDDRLNVLQSRGQTSQFLEITPGAVSWNLLRILRESIANEVTAAVQRAVRENIPASEVVSILDEQQHERRVQVDVLPITSAAARPRSFLILFQNLESGDGKPAELPVVPKLTMDEKDRLIAQLRQDLNATRFHLQSLVEERDARNQELVSANEEIQSANEELQSTNEELETTKEELQSANEELQTVNDELQQRNSILTQTGNDLANLLNSVNIPLLMLTSDLHIRQFTPPMQRLLSVRPTDIGRSISEIRLQLSIENIEPILIDVLETLGTREMEVQDREGRWHLLRVRPYRTSDNKIGGLVVVLVDIDQLRRSQQHLVDARDFASSVVESVPVPIVVLNEDCTMRTVNTAFRQLAQMPSKDLEERSMPELTALLWGIDDLRERMASLLQSQSGATLEFEHASTKAPQKTLLIKARALSTDGSRVLLLMIEDITLRREAELLVNRQKKMLEGEVATAAHELRRTQDELRGLTAHLFTVQEDERQRVARELHDDVSQRLSALDIMLQGIVDQKGAKEAMQGLADVRQQLETLNNDVRVLSHRLHPAILSELGLSAALRALVKEFGEREGMLATFSTHKLPDGWSNEAATSIYRITQEALRNVAKHAGKTHVKVILSGEGDRLQLKVMDFGVGFDLEAERSGQGLGMISMQERARLVGGVFNVQSVLGQGTTVTVDIPLKPHA